MSVELEFERQPENVLYFSDAVERIKSSEPGNPDGEVQMSEWLLVIASLRERTLSWLREDVT